MLDQSPRRVSRSSKPASGLHSLPTNSREQMEAASRLGPWDREIGWKPEQAAIERARASRPFWMEWDRELIEAIEDLRLGINLRSGHGRAQAFDHERVPHRAGADMSPEDEARYRRFLTWLAEMHDAGLRQHVMMVCGVLVDEAPCPDRVRFRRAIDIHARIRRLGTDRRPGEEMPAHLRERLDDTRRRHSAARR
jgi:hypothetical protein